MSDDRIKQYLDALNELDSAIGDLFTIRQIVRDIYRELEDPYQFNSSYAAVLPTAKRITDAIANLRQKYTNAQQLWKSLSPIEQNRIDAPPSLPIKLK